MLAVFEGQGRESFFFFLPHDSLPLQLFFPAFFRFLNPMKQCAFSWHRSTLDLVLSASSKHKCCINKTTALIKHHCTLASFPLCSLRKHHLKSKRSPPSRVMVTDSLVVTLPVHFEFPFGHEQALSHAISGCRTERTTHTPSLRTIQCKGLISQRRCDSVIWIIWLCTFLFSCRRLSILLLLLLLRWLRQILRVKHFTRENI